jgi:serine/threonine protein phosphatase PrpC
MQIIQFLHAQLAAAEAQELSTGLAMVYSAPAPGKESANEDAAALVSVEPDSTVLIVADGVGGQQAGDEAAQIAIDSIIGAIRENQENQSLRDSILDGIERANRRILAMGKGSATTVVVAEIQRRQLRTYYVGDSLILVTGQRGRLKFQNTSHSPVGYALESGFIDEEEAIHHEERNLVSNVIGTAEMSIEIGPVMTISPRDTLVLASDSLPDNLYVEEIVENVRTGKLEQVAARLTDMVDQRMRNPEPGLPGHSDDFTFILYRPVPG